MRPGIKKCVLIEDEAGTVPANSTGDKPAMSMPPSVGPVLKRKNTAEPLKSFAQFASDLSK